MEIKDIFNEYNKKHNKAQALTVEFDKQLLSTMKVGGKVSAVVYPSTKEETIRAIRLCKDNGLDYFVCGNLSNTIIKDEGYNGVVIKVYNNYKGYSREGDIFRVKSGTPIIPFIKEVTKMGYGGLEFASGIPGSLGGAVFMNAGAFKGEMSEVVLEVTYFDGEKEGTLTLEELDFAYRHSAFKNMKGVVILEVVLKLKEGKGDLEKIKRLALIRKEKQPTNKPNCGSVFKSPPGDYAARLIEEAGLKGKRVGGAVVSTKHSGFIVNDNNAKADDVLTLVKQVQEEVYNKYNIALESEWIILGE